MNPDRLVKATGLAWLWHGHQTRKGKATPYMSHLLHVQGLVLEHGGSSDQAIAALLHDALEDAPSASERQQREAEIELHFGAGVLRIVLLCTDTSAAESEANKAPWRERKERYIAQLETASPDVLLVVACDKRHNLGDLMNDVREEGAATFDRFNADSNQQLWYFSTLAELCRPHIPSRLARELEELVAELNRFVVASV